MTPNRIRRMVDTAFPETATLDNPINHPLQPTGSFYSLASNHGYFGRMGSSKPDGFSINQQMSRFFPFDFGLPGVAWVSYIRHCQPRKKVKARETYDKNPRNTLTLYSKLVLACTKVFDFDLDRVTKDPYVTPVRED